MYWYAVNIYGELYKLIDMVEGQHAFCQTRELKPTVIPL